MKTEEKSGIEIMLEYIKRDIDEIKEKLDSKYVSYEAFEPVRKIAYGLAAFALSAVGVWLISFTKPK